MYYLYNKQKHKTPAAQKSSDSLAPIASYTCGFGFIGFQNTSYFIKVNCFCPKPKRMLMVPFEYIKGFPSKSMRIQRGSLRETISNLRKLNTIWLEILRISFECISDFHKILKNLMRNLRTPLGNWRESLQFDDNSKRNSDGTPGNVKGDPLRTRRELKKRRLMVSYRNSL